jgi:hypothetical protein
MVKPGVSTRWRRVAIRAGLALVLLIARVGDGAVGVVSAAPAAGEGLVRAAFLHKFLLFTDFPRAAFASDSEPLTICAWTTHDEAQALAQLEHKNVRGHALRVKQAPFAEGDANLRGCQVLFASLHSSARATRAALAEAEGKPILTVGEHDAFLAWNGMIRLLVKNGRMTFEVNVASARRSSITFRAQMLRIAEKVVD